MNIQSAKRKIKKAYDTMEWAKNKGYNYHNYILIEFDKILASKKLSYEDTDELIAWYNANYANK